jgi:gas vesicle protein
MAEGPQDLTRTSAPADVTGPEQPTPEELRRQIADTRQGLSSTLDNIEDRVSPTRIRERRTAQIKSRFSRLRDSVMGSSEEGYEDHYAGPSRREQIAERVGEARESVMATPVAARERARGNPLAAGIIAFGGGLLLASVLPATEPEQEAAERLRDRFEEPVKDQLRQAGQETKDRLQEPVQQAVEEVKQTAQDATERTKSDAQSATAEVRQDTRHS